MSLWISFSRTNNIIYIRNRLKEDCTLVCVSWHGIISRGEASGGDWAACQFSEFKQILVPQIYFCSPCLNDCWNSKQSSFPTAWNWSLGCCGGQLSCPFDPINACLHQNPFFSIAFCHCLFLSFYHSHVDKHIHTLTRILIRQTSLGWFFPFCLVIIVSLDLAHTRIHTAPQHNQDLLLFHVLWRWNNDRLRMFVCVCVCIGYGWWKNSLKQCSQSSLKETCNQEMTSAVQNDSTMLGFSQTHTHTLTYIEMCLYIWAHTQKNCQVRRPKDAHGHRTHIFVHILKLKHTGYILLLDGCY